MHNVFEALRKEVLALDPCVTEEFLKLYVAYKAETNFVDVVPQSKRLRLSLNLSFHEINDPKGICRDVTGMGRWGNGDVEVGLSSIDQLPYVLGSDSAVIRKTDGKRRRNLAASGHAICLHKIPLGQPGLLLLGRNHLHAE
jgi:predicted transport protein